MPDVRPSRALAGALLAFSVVAVAACGDDPVSPESRVRSIDLPGLSARDTLVGGDTLRLQPVLKDASGRVIANAHVRFSTATAVGPLSVDSSGKVTTREIGTETVYIESGSVRDSVIFTVVHLAIRSEVSLLSIVDSTRMNAVLETGYGEPAATVRWSSTDSSILRVDSAGLVRPVSFGTAAIVATWTGPHGDAVDSQRVTVPMTKIQVPALVSVDAGAEQACGATAEGQIWCWGAHLIPGLRTDYGYAAWRTDPAVVATDQHFAHMSVGYGAACGWTAAGETWCWGGNAWRIAAPDTANLPGLFLTTPRRIATAPAFANGGFVSPRGQACGISAANVADCWGLNFYYTLGRPRNSALGSNQGDTVIAPVAGSHQFVQVDGDGYNMCGLDAAGAAWCWGDTPWEITPAAAGVHDVTQGGAGVQYASIAMGFDFVVCGLTASNDAYCWGHDDRGQLGTGAVDTQKHDTPQLVVGGHKWKKLVGGWGICGIDLADKLYCWGDYAMGFRGVEAARPQPVAPQLSFRDFSMSTWGGGFGWGCGVTTAGETYCFKSAR